MMLLAIWHSQKNLTALKIAKDREQQFVLMSLQKKTREHYLISLIKIFSERPFGRRNRPWVERYLFKP